MFIIQDDKKLLNLNYLEIFLFVDGTIFEATKERLKSINQYTTLNRNLFRFNILEKGNTELYKDLPDNMIKFLENNYLNIYVRLINGIHDSYYYAIGDVDLSKDDKELYKALNKFIDEVCREDSDRLLALAYRFTSTAISAQREYRNQCIFKEMFDLALEGKFTKEQREAFAENLQSNNKTADRNDSLEIGKNIVDNSQDAILKEQYERTKPEKKPKILATIKRISYQAKKGREKRDIGIDFDINGNNVPVRFGTKEQKMLYIGTLLMRKNGNTLKKSAFTKNEEEAQWLHRLFSCFGFDAYWDVWKENVQKSYCHPLSVAKTVLNTKIWEKLKNVCPDAYYYCCLRTDKEKTKESCYTTKLDPRNIDIEIELKSFQDLME